MVDVRNVSRVFIDAQHESGAAVLKGISIRVRRGEFVAITGASGSGKSSLLNIMGLLDKPTAGSYKLAGQETTNLGAGALTVLRGTSIGFVFQDFHLITHRTVQDNVALGLLYRGVKSKARQAAAKDALEMVGLSHRLHAYPPTLSGGERQRTAIARALIGQPRQLLLCDEPTGNLDSVATAQVMTLLRSLNARGATVVVITHDKAIAASADREIHLRDGAVVWTQSSPTATT